MGFIYLIEELIKKRNHMGVGYIDRCSLNENKHKAERIGIFRHSHK
jgi:hypothetical protein